MGGAVADRFCGDSVYMTLGIEGEMTYVHIRDIAEIGESFALVERYRGSVKRMRWTAPETPAEVRAFLSTVSILT